MTSLPSDQPAIDDLLGFGQYATILSEVIRATEPPFTVGIFGEWGSGKTTLMQMVGDKLAESGIKTVWFNAWKYDGKEVIWNALIQSIFLEMLRDAEVRGDNDFSKRIHDAAAGLALFAAKRFLPLLTAGAVSAEDVDDVRAALKPLSANEESFSFINEFEANFRDLVEQYVGKEGRLVVFVDDLDRCLPENAVAVLEAIKLYLDQANVTFVIGVEPEVVRDGIRHRYRENPSLQGKEYLEKMVQLPFVMRGLEAPAALSLLQPYIKAGLFNNHEDPRVLNLVQVGTEANPRRIKRFANTLHVLRLIAEVDGHDLNGDDVYRLCLVLLTQMRRPAFYEELIRQPSLIEGYNTAVQLSSEDRDKRFAATPALKSIHDDDLLRDLFQASRDIDCSQDRLVKWLRFATVAKA